MKQFAALLSILLLTLMTATAFADSTISQLPSGGLVNPLDVFPDYNPNFPGENFGVTFGTAAAVSIGTSGPTLGLLNTSNAYSALQSFASGDLTAADPVFTGGSITLPAGTTAARPGSPVNGMIRYNTSLAEYEAYASGAWSPLGSGGSGSGITALTGDLTASGSGSVAATLATVNSNVGTFGSASSVPQITTNGKGLTTGVASVTITPAAIGAPTTTGTGASGTWAIGISGNAATSTALAALPSQCSGSQFATGIAANGAANCATPSGSGNVSGPGSSTNLFVPQWNGTTGTLLQAGLPVATTGVSTIVETSGSGLLVSSIIPTLNQNTTGNASTVTTNANLTGPITSVGNATSVASQTGTGSQFMMSASPTTSGTFNGAAAIWSGTDTALNFAATGTGADTLPVGAASQRPGSPAAGMIRYNTTPTPTVEAYVNGAWVSLNGLIANSSPSLPYTVAAGDMNGQLNLTGTGTVTIPAISTTVFPANTSLCINNEGSGTITVSSTPTINGFSGSTIPTKTFLCMISNGTSIDSFGTTASSGGGGGTPGGTNGQIQFNNSGAFGGYTSVPLANGGTNATTASSARLNLGASALNASAELPNFTAGLLNVINNVGGSFPKVCASGDSTTGGTDGGINNVNYGYPTWVALMLQSSYGVKSSYSSFWGTGIGNGNGPAYGLTQGNSWTGDSAVLSAGGYAFTATTNTNSLAYNPQDVFANQLSVDTFKVYYVVQSGNGVLYEDVDGANSSTFSTSGTSAVGVTTVTTTLGTHTLNLKWSSGGKVDVIGVEGYNSTVPAVLVDNYGVGSQTAFGGANTATNPWNPGNSALYTALGCTVSIANYGINDEDTSVSQANFIAAMTTILNAQKVAGDVVVLTHNPSNPSGGGAAVSTQTAFMSALKTLAVSLSLPVVDTFNRWQTYAYSLPYGVYGDTLVHPNAQGYHEIATAVLQGLVGIPVPGSDQASFLGSRLFVHPSNGNVGIANVNPSAALHVGNTVSGGGSLEIDSNSTSRQVVSLWNNQAGYYAAVDYQASSGHFLAGVGGGSAGLGVANKYFIFDWGTSVVPFDINSSDQISLGTTTATAGAELTVSGNASISGAYDIGSANALSFNAADSGTLGSSLAIGVSALAGQTSSAAYKNTAIGYQALDGTMTTAAVQNTAVGYQAGNAITTGSGNTFLGYQAGLTSTTHTGLTLIGAGTSESNNNDTVLGSGAGASGCCGGGTALGASTNANGTNSVAIGYQSNAQAGSISIGSAISDFSSSSQINIGGTGQGNNGLDIGNVIAGVISGGTNPTVCSVGEVCRLGHITGANLNSTSDQAIVIGPMTSSNGSYLSSATKYIITEIDVGNCSVSTTTAQGGFYTAASKGGTIIGATTTPYTNCQSSGTRQRLTGVTNMDSSILTAATIYLSLTAAQGATDTGDIDVYGIPYN